MKFTKTAVAVAIAGFAATPMIASADTTLYGVVEINLFGNDSDDNEVAVGVGDVLFGISSEHELNSGLTGFGNLRIDLDRLSNDGAIDVENDPLDEEDDVTIGSAGTADDVHVGIKGGFGEFRLGEIPLTVEYGQVANDIFDVGAEINGGLSYEGDFGPVGVGLNFSPEGNNLDADGIDGEAIYGAGVKFALAGFGIGAGAETRDDNLNYSVGATYAIFGAAIGAHYWVQEDANDTVDDAGVAIAAGDLESFSIKVDYGIAGIQASITYSEVEDDLAVDTDALRLDLGYQLGGGTFVSTRITNETDNTADGDDDLLAWRVQLAKSF